MAIELSVHKRNQKREILSSGFCSSVLRLHSYQRRPAFQPIPHEFSGVDYRIGVATPCQSRLDGRNSYDSGGYDVLLLLLVLTAAAGTAKESLLPSISFEEKEEPKNCQAQLGKQAVRQVFCDRIGQATGDEGRLNRPVVDSKMIMTT